MHQKRVQKKFQNPGSALENGATVGTGFHSYSPKAALSSLLEVINAYRTGKGLNLGIFLKFLPNKRLHLHYS